VQGAPDLVVEVLSIATAAADRTTKLKLYAHYGVLEYWLIDPEECFAEICRRGVAGFERAASLGPADLLATPLLPGFSVLLKKLAE
jgi:Uma2 family endonuclease